MSNSILDTLQIVQVTDDDSNDFGPKKNTRQYIEQNNHLDQTDQNAHLKASCSTKPSVQMTSSWSQKSKSSLTRHTLPSRKSIKHENDHNQARASQKKTQLKKLNNNDKFVCQSCVHEPNQKCQICKGTSQLTGNDKLIKFFEYVLEFKLGRNQSYRPKQQKIISKRTIPNEHCSIYFSSIAPALSIQEGPYHDARFSLGNEHKRLVSIHEDEDRVKNCQDIHYNYGCDQCQTDPIVGPRYHCNTCGDFDLCEACAKRIGHYHQLQIIELKSNKKVQQKINNMLKCNNQSALRSSIRSGSSLRNTMGNKACKSWIR